MQIGKDLLINELLTLTEQAIKSIQEFKKFYWKLFFKFNESKKWQNKKDENAKGQRPFEFITFN
jgi:hypothetical protein